MNVIALERKQLQFQIRLKKPITKIESIKFVQAINSFRVQFDTNKRSWPMSMLK